MRVGWLADDAAIRGGAELAADRLAQTGGDRGHEVVTCPPAAVVPDLDAYVVHNCVTYTMRDIEPLSIVGKVIHDMMPHGDGAVREWLLAGSAFVTFSSPLHRDSFPHQVLAPDVLIPPACDLTPFRDAGARSAERKGTIWLGNMLGPHKGVEAAVQWARQYGPVDFYGHGDPPAQEVGSVYYRGALEPDEVPEVMARYERLLFLPAAPEPFSLVVAEAWAAGLKLTVNENVGAVWWLQRHPDEIERGAAMFWDRLERAVSDAAARSGAGRG